VHELQSPAIALRDAEEHEVPARLKYLVHVSGIEKYRFAAPN
jgi:hypothetical protein